MTDMTDMLCHSPHDMADMTNHDKLQSRDGHANHG